MNLNKESINQLNKETEYEKFERECEHSERVIGHGCAIVAIVILALICYALFC